MARDSCRALTIFALVTSAVIATDAAARPPQLPGAPPAPHAAAPAPAPHPAPAIAAPPHIAAPQPHFAPPAAPHIAAPAPHIAAPHFAASPPHMAAPHFAMPHPAPHSAAAPHAPPHIAQAPHVAAPRPAPPHVAASRHAPRGAFAQMREPAPSKLASPSRGPQKANIAPAQRAAAPNAPKPGQAKVATPPAVQPQQQRPSDSSRRTVGLAPEKAQQQLSPAERQRFEAARRAPILRSPVFAGATSNSTAHLAQPTFRGAFAESPFGRDRNHHRHLGVVLGFVGPVFWPYAYSDFVDYTFSPYAYDTFWPYAFDDVYAGIFGGYAPEYYAADDVYAYAGAAASERAYSRLVGATPRPVTASSGTTARICTGQAQGITDFSIDKIAQQVEPNQKQQDLLNKLKEATVKAVNLLQDACPTELPSTPTGRLDGMLTRVNAMLQAVQTVRPALDDFYQSLSDEQRERFNMLDQNTTADRSQHADLARLCGNAASSGSALPTARIERSLKLSPDQQTALKQLEDASAKAADTLRTKCQADQTLTPTGRLAAMEDRLSAMAQALTATRAALTSFYGSLSDEQKARFDRTPFRATT